jgi:hypothetical protein
MKRGERKMFSKNHRHPIRRVSAIRSHETRGALHNPDHDEPED